MKKLLLTILLLITSDVFAQRPPILTNQYNRAGTRFYVSATGSQYNSGRSAIKPWNFARLNTFKFKNGDTISFKGGDIITGGGASFFGYNNKRLILNSYGTGKAILKFSGGQNTLLSFFSDTIKVDIKNIKFEGLYNAQTQTGGSTNSRGVWILNNQTNPSAGGINSIVIDSCEFKNFRQEAIRIDIKSYYKRGNVLIRHNKFDSLGLHGMHITGICYSNFQIIGNRLTNIFGRSDNSYSFGMQIQWCRDGKIERNYFSEIGKYSSIGAAGCHVDASRNFELRYNEVHKIRLIINEGAGLYGDCGCDSLLFEYNFITGCEGGGIVLANAPTSWCGGWGAIAGFQEDTLEASYNIARFNIILSDSGWWGIAINSYTDYGFHNNPQKRNIIYNNLIYLKKSGEWHYPLLPMGIVQGGRADSTYIYNNIFITDSAVCIRTDSSDAFVNAFIHNNIYWQTNGLNNRIGEWQLGFTYEPSFHWLYREFVSIQNWADTTGFEKNGASYTYFNTNPDVRKLYFPTVEINPYHLDTLASFQTLSSSISKNNGVNYNTVVIRLADTTNTDFYGNAIPYLNKDIGVFEQ